MKSYLEKCMKLLALDLLHFKGLPYSPRSCYASFSLQLKAVAILGDILKCGMRKNYSCSNYSVNM